MKRAVNAAVLGLAALTFFLFPIGGKTTFQHAVAIFTSRPAREAGASFAAAGRRASDAVRAELRKVLGRAADAERERPDPSSTDDPKRPEKRGDDP